MLIFNCILLSPHAVQYRYFHEVGRQKKLSAWFFLLCIFLFRLMLFIPIYLPQSGFVYATNVHPKYPRYYQAYIKTLKSNISLTV